MQWKVQNDFQINPQSGFASAQLAGPEPAERPAAALPRVHMLDFQTLHLVQERLPLAVSQSRAISLGSQYRLLILIATIPSGEVILK